MKNNPHLGDEPIDIEDLVNIGQTFGPYVLIIIFYIHANVFSWFASWTQISHWKWLPLSVAWTGLLAIYLECLSCRCPYFMTRELQKTVDIVFAPYNYLIDPWFRKGLGVEWKNSILIFDEAHNLVRRNTQILDLESSHVKLLRLSRLIFECFRFTFLLIHSG